jgi:FAD/FMN-containing dehydrogenase
MSNDAFLPLLQRRLPAQCILTDPEDLRPCECDALSAYRNLPLAVVIPETLAQIRTTLQLCTTHGIPVVARGAGTGLSGGALPLSGGHATLFRGGDRDAVFHPLPAPLLALHRRLKCNLDPAGILNHGRMYAEL